MLDQAGGRVVWDGYNTGMEFEIRHRKRCKRYNVVGHAHELTFSCFHNRPFLRSERALGYLTEAVASARVQHDFSLWAYVFMPEHVHLLICPNGRDYSISRILQGIKQPVGRKVIRFCQDHSPTGLKWLATGQRRRQYRFWQEGGGYDRNISLDQTLVSMVRYIHANPVRRELVGHPLDWRWSSARTWQGMKGELPIDLATWPLG